MEKTQMIFGRFFKKVWQFQLAHWNKMVVRLEDRKVKPARVWVAGGTEEDYKNALRYIKKKPQQAPRISNVNDLGTIQFERGEPKPIIYIAGPCSTKLRAAIEERRLKKLIRVLPIR